MTTIAGGGASPEETCCRLYEATTSTSDALRGLYVLGALLDRSERVAVHAQQIRAINLVHALKVARGLGPDSRLCVVGAGVAGLTAAAYAMSQGVGVTVLEHRAPLWNLRGCRTRWLHPNMFRWWPDPRWKVSATNLPVMNWYAGYACDVGELLYAKYLAFEQEQARTRARLGSSASGLQRIRDLVFTRAGAAWQVDWWRAGSGTRATGTFDAVIVAIGFGAEARTRDADASVYWLDDALEREDPHRLHRRYLVSGTGDGGLTDALRIRSNEFRHHHLRSILLAAGDDRALVEAVTAAEQLDDPTDAYMTLARGRLGQPFQRPFLSTCARPTAVLLTNRDGGALRSGAWPMSRFLAALLLAWDPDTTFRNDLLHRTPLPSTGDRAPAGFALEFASAPQHETVDAIVIRHGPLAVIDPFLERLGLTPGDVAGLRAKWSEARRAGPTDTPIFDEGCANEDRSRRNQTGWVEPPLAGRTTMGMLSRLVGNVGPDRDAGPTRRPVIASGSLMSDEVAGMLTFRGDRHQMSVDPGGWQMAQGIEHHSVEEAIVSADAALGSLWADAPRRAPEMQHAWVLPRPPWVAPGHLLRHTCVSRGWQDWVLRYHHIPGTPPVRRVRPTERWLLRQIPRLAPGILPGEPKTLVIVDLCARAARIAIVAEARDGELIREEGHLPRRLASEMHSDCVVFMPSLRVEWMPRPAVETPLVDVS